MTNATKVSRAMVPHRQCMARWLAGTAMLMIAVPAFAQSTPATPTSPEAQATQQEPEQAGAPGDIVVTARKRDELLKDVPVAMQVVTGADLDKYAANNLNQIAEATTQVLLLPTGSGNGATLAIRGISSTNADNGVDSSVTINLDGLQISRGRTITQTFFDVGSVEVLKGPQVLFFGKNSPAGVISIHSAEPTKDWQFSGKAYYEFNDNEFIGEAIASGPLTDTLGVRVAYQGVTSRGWLKNNAQPQPVQAGLPREPFAFPGATDRWLGGRKSNLLRVTLNWEPTSNFTANLKVMGADEHLDATGSIKELVSCSGAKPASRGFVDPNGDCSLNGETSAGAIPRELQQKYRGIEFLDDGGPYNRFKSVVGILNMKYETDNFSIASVTGVHAYRNFRWDDYDGTVWNFLGANEVEKYRQIDQEVRVLSKFDGPLNFLLGGFYEDSKRTQDQNFKIAALGFDPVTGFSNSGSEQSVGNGTSKAVFGQVIYNPIPSVELTAGVRASWERVSGVVGYDYVHSFLTALFLPEGKQLFPRLNDSNVSPEITARWTISPAVSVYAAYKTGFKAGGFSTVAIISPTSTGDSLIYSPEKAKGGEVGLRGRLLDGRLTGSLTGYYYDYTNGQDSVFNAVTTSYVIRNADSRSTGVDFDTTFRATPELRLRAQLGYNDAHYLEYRNSPCWSGQLVSEGCAPGPGGANIQDISGRTRAFAPKLDGGAGADYDTPISGSLRIGGSLDVHYTSAYDTQPTLNPFGRQGSIFRVNANLRLGQIDDRWEVSLIGRNLTNKRYIGAAVDQPGGTRGDVLGDVIRPRQIAIQTSVKF